MSRSLGYFMLVLIPVKSVIKNMIKRTNISSSLLLSAPQSLCNPSVSLKSFHPFTSSENCPANYTSQFTCLDSENKCNYCYFCIKHGGVNPKVRPAVCVGRLRVFVRLLQLSLIYSITGG